MTDIVDILTSFRMKQMFLRAENKSLEEPKINYRRFQNVYHLSRNFTISTGCVMRRSQVYVNCAHLRLHICKWLHQVVTCVSLFRAEVEHLPTDIRNNVDVGGDEDVGWDTDDATGSRQ